MYNPLCVVYVSEIEEGEGLYVVYVSEIEDGGGGSVIKFYNFLVKAIEM